jgi:hypothetical protein
VKAFNPSNIREINARTIQHLNDSSTDPLRNEEKKEEQEEDTKILGMKQYMSS